MDNCDHREAKERDLDRCAECGATRQRYPMGGPQSVGGKIVHPVRQGERAFVWGVWGRKA